MPLFFYPRVPSLPLFLTIVPLNFSWPPYLNYMNSCSLLPLLGICLIPAFSRVAFACHIDLMVSVSHQNLSPSEDDGFSHRMSVTQVTQQTAILRTSGDFRSFPDKEIVVSSQTHTPREYQEPQGSTNSSPALHCQSWQCLAFSLSPTHPSQPWSFQKMCVLLSKVLEILLKFHLHSDW